MAAIKKKPTALQIISSQRTDSEKNQTKKKIIYSNPSQSLIGRLKVKVNCFSKQLEARKNKHGNKCAYM